MEYALKKRSGWMKRKARVRKSILSSTDRLRLNVFRSNKHIYAQVVDDSAGKVLVSASTICKELREKCGGLSKVDAAKEVGELVGKLAKDNGIEEVVFDRSGYLFHGRVKALADGAREAGLRF